MSGDDLFLCLDQGGHASRAAVFDRHGQLLALATRDIETRREGLRVEHDPIELRESLRSAADEVIRSVDAPAARWHSAGLATQRSSIVCWDRDTLNPLSPVLSWQDRRAADWLETYRAHEPRIHAITGLVLSPHYGVSKLRWCVDELPAVTAALNSRTLRMGPLASWLAAALGEAAPAADPANASRTLLWDRRSRDWSDDLLTLFGLRRDWLPPAADSEGAFGQLSAGGVTIPLRLVTGDQSAALFAFGKPRTDTLYANLGTGAFLQQPLENPEADPGRLLASVVRSDELSVYGVLEATINGAGAAINSVAQELGLSMGEVKQSSSGWLESLPADGPLFLNAVSGLGSPWWDALAMSRFEDASGATPEVRMAAVIESIAFLLATNIEAMRERDAEPRRLLATGGLSRVTPLLRRVANLAGLPVERARVVEATARGVACQLAGLPNDWPAADVDVRLDPAPDPELRARFDRWRSLMPAVPDVLGR